MDNKERQPVPLRNPNKQRENNSSRDGQRTDKTQAQQ
jgi:hypothetical protein